MNDKEFFEKIGLEGTDRCNDPFCIDECEICRKGETVITADHILELEGLIKWPYSFEIRIDDHGDTIYNFLKMTDSKPYVQSSPVFFSTCFFIHGLKTRKEALLSLISWMIDKEILTKEQVRAVFE